MRYAMRDVLTGVVGIAALTVMAGPPSHAHAARAATAGVVGTSDRGLATSSTLLDATTGQGSGQLYPSQLYIGQFGGFGLNDGQFYGPNSIAIGHGGRIDGIVFVADNSRIQEFSASGRFLGSFGEVVCGNSPDDAGINLAAGPTSIASDNNGNIYALYVDNAGTAAGGPGGNFLRKYDFHPGYPTIGHIATGDRPATQAYPDPQGITADSSGNVYVAEGGHGVQEFSPLGAFVRQFGTPGHGPHFGSFGSINPISPDELDSPRAMAIDSGGNLYVADIGTQRVVEFNPSGAVVQHFGYTTRQLGGEATGPGELDHPRGVAVDPAGNVYVADDANYRVTEFSPSGVALSQFDRDSVPDQTFGPTAIAINAGVIYVAELFNDVVEEFGVVGAPVTNSNSATTIDASSPYRRG